MHGLLSSPWRCASATFQSTFRHRCSNSLHPSGCVPSNQGCKNIELVAQPSGTGQMLSSLEPSNQKIDVAVALTEGLITGIARGRKDYRLIGSYVRTSLNWCVPSDLGDYYWHESSS